jgi:hypothetical protein
MAAGAPGTQDNDVRAPGLRIDLLSADSFIAWRSSDGHRHDRQAQHDRLSLQ